MNKEALAAGHETKKDVLREVIKGRTWKIQPDTLTSEQWSRQRKIGFQYAFTDKTLDQLGKQYGGLSRERVRQLNQDFLDNIFQTSPKQLRSEYPRETIPDRKPTTPETREKMSAAQKGKKGHIVSPETREKISAAKKGHIVSPETREKMSAAQKGRFRGS